MVHKSSVIPGLSRFLDENILSHYPPTSLKRVVIAGFSSLYLKQNERVVDTLLSNPMFAALGVSNSSGMVDIDVIRDVMKTEISKAGFVRLTFPVIGDIDFTIEDVDALHKFITESNTQTSPSTSTSARDSSTSSYGVGGVY